MTEEIKLQPPTEEGVGFLKTATAAPDFQTTDLEGIPDRYTGPTITKKDYILTPVECNAGATAYFVVTPTAGVSHYTSSVTSGTLFQGVAFTGQEFPDAMQLFPSIHKSGNVYGSNTSVVNRGRVVSMAAELQCTTNALNQYGVVSVIKTPLIKEIVPNRVTNALHDSALISGAVAFQANTLSASAYMAPVKDGAYAVSFNREEEFGFVDVLDNVYSDSSWPANLTTEIALPGSADHVLFNGASVLWDNSYDSIVFRVTVPPGVADQSFVLKVWKTFEYQPVYNSLLYTMSHLSPDYDPGTLAIYREIGRALPTAVASKENPDFWNTVLDAVSRASSVLSLVPGPIGTVAKGVHAVSSVLTPALKRKAKKKKPKPSRKAKPGLKKNK